MTRWIVVILIFLLAAAVANVVLTWVIGLGVYAVHRMRHGTSDDRTSRMTFREAKSHTRVFDSGFGGLSVIALAAYLASGAGDTGHRVAELIFGAVFFLGGLGLLHEAVKHRIANRVDARRRRHQCVSCGYDLRGSESACPECGAPGDIAN